MAQEWSIGDQFVIYILSIFSDLLLSDPCLEKMSSLLSLTLTNSHLLSQIDIWQIIPSTRSMKLVLSSAR